jgi:hypothetical protein
VLLSVLVLLRPLRLALLARLSRFTSFPRFARLPCFPRLSGLTWLACLVRPALSTRLSGSAAGLLALSATLRVRLLLVTLLLMTMATLAAALVVMMLMPTFTRRGLVIVPIGHRPATVTMDFAAKRRLGVLAAAALGTAGSR